MLRKPLPESEPTVVSAALNCPSGPRCSGASLSIAPVKLPSMWVAPWCRKGSVDPLVMLASCSIVTLPVPVSGLGRKVCPARARWPLATSGPTAPGQAKGEPMRSVPPASTVTTLAGFSQKLVCSVRVPVPVLVKLPEPPSGPEKVVELLSLPARNVPEVMLRKPLPESEPTSPPAVVSSPVGPMVSGASLSIAPAADPVRWP